MSLCPRAQELAMDVIKARQANNVGELRRLKTLIRTERDVDEISDMDRCEILHLFSSPLYEPRTAK